MSPSYTDTNNGARQRISTIKCLLVPRSRHSSAPPSRVPSPCSLTKILILRGSRPRLPILGHIRHSLAPAATIRAKQSPHELVAAFRQTKIPRAPLHLRNKRGRTPTNTDIRLGHQRTGQKLRETLRPGGTQPDNRKCPKKLRAGTHAPLPPTKVPT